MGGPKCSGVPLARSRQCRHLRSRSRIVWMIALVTVVRATLETKTARDRGDRAPLEKTVRAIQFSIFTVPDL